MSLEDRLTKLEIKTANDYGGFEDSNPENLKAARQAILSDLLELIGEQQHDDGWIDREVLRDKVRKYCA